MYHGEANFASFGTPAKKVGTHIHNMLGLMWRLTGVVSKLPLDLDAGTSHVVVGCGIEIMWLLSPPKCSFDVVLDFTFAFSKLMRGSTGNDVSLPRRSFLRPIVENCACPSNRPMTVHLILLQPSWLFLTLRSQGWVRQARDKTGCVWEWRANHVDQLPLS